MCMFLFILDPDLWRLGSICQRPQICWLCKAGNRRCLSHDYWWNGECCNWPFKSWKGRTTDRTLWGGSVWWDELCYIILNGLQFVIYINRLSVWLWCSLHHKLKYIQLFIFGSAGQLIIIFNSFCRYKEIVVGYLNDLTPIALHISLIRA